MKLSERRREEQSQVIPDQPKKRMLPFFKHILNIPETTHIISVQVDQHLITIEFGPFVHPQLFIPVQVDAKKSQMDMVVTLGQHCYYFIELRWKKDLIYCWEIHLELFASFESYVLPP